MVVFKTDEKTPNPNTLGNLFFLFLEPLNQFLILTNWRNSLHVDVRRVKLTRSRQLRQADMQRLSSSCTEQAKNPDLTAELRQPQILPGWKSLKIMELICPEPMASSKYFPKNCSGCDEVSFINFNPKGLTEACDTDTRHLDRSIYPFKDLMPFEASRECGRCHLAEPDLPIFEK